MIVRFADLMVNIPMSVPDSWLDSISAVMASIGLLCSTILLEFVKELHCFFYVDDDFAASLHSGVFEDCVFVVLCCDVGDVEEFFYATYAIDVLSGCCS